jgi:hypothetical protein
LPDRRRVAPEVLVAVNPDFPEGNIIPTGRAMDVQPHFPRVGPPARDMRISADLLTLEVLPALAECLVAMVPDPVGHLRKREVPLPEGTTINLSER